MGLHYKSIPNYGWKLITHLRITFLLIHDNNDSLDFVQSRNDTIVEVVN